MTTHKIETGRLATLLVEVEPPSDETRRTVAAVMRHHEEDVHERVVFETPGVLEAFDEALDELEALKRSM